ncbi:MAG TPA: choice-of-anchor Q domain-containing protein [Bryobacteraceae bacterium]|nr:choice-of-anchor Q domain-containing protein [Bryobacteraceae bacterium]
MGRTVNYGGGIDNGWALAVSNSTLSGNSSAHGGGIANWWAVTLSNSTLSGNAGPSGGSAISTYYSWTSVEIKNSILANSTAGGTCLEAGGSLTSLGHNLADDSSCTAFFNQPGDMNSTAAGLDPAGLKNNGGPTQTIALLPTSVAVDAIPVSACTDVAGNPVTTDQRGVKRPQGPACDIGAFELVPMGAGLPLTLLQ